LETRSRVLVAIPAFNEERSVKAVIERVREYLVDFDLLVVNDGSRDRTGRILRELGVMSATHLCNLGYGRAIQTAIKYALRFDYDTLITLDADGQHHPEHVRSAYDAHVKGGWDVLIGSRYVESRDYSQSPLGRRIGMRLFSWLVRVVGRKQIYDTTSGLKIIRRSAFEPLARWHFIDFHAEAIVYLLRLGYRIGEYPIVVSERKHGQSMYSWLSHVTYPVKTLLILLIGIVEAEITRRSRR